MSTVIPATPDEVTAGWLSEVLGSDIDSVEVSPVGGVQGFVGVVVRLRLGHRGSAPDSLIAKLAATNAQSLEYVRNYGLYRSEHHFYRGVADRVPVRVPACHHAALSDDGMGVALLLEDLGHLRAGDQLAGASASDAERVVRAVARLHGAWWDHPDLDALGWLPAVNTDLSKARGSHAAVAWAPFLERHGDCANSSVRSLGEAIPRIVPDMLEDWWSRRPRTYVHFDARLDNIFFDDSQDVADSVCLLDWQMSLRGLGASDLAWFLSWSLIPEVRRDAHDALLDAYLDELVTAGVSDYDRAMLDQDLREALVLVMAMTILGGGTAPTPDERSAAVIRALVERVTACVDELGVADVV